MRKNLLLYLLVALCMPTFSYAQKISAPGFKKHYKEIVSAKRATENNRTKRRNYAQPAFSQPQQYVMMAEENETKGIRLLKDSREEFYKSSNNTNIYENEYTYDKYGFFHKRQNLKLDEWQLVEYQWYVPGWKWSEKIDQWYYNNGGTYNSTTTTKRTFHPNGSVYTSTVYNDDNQVETEETYDESGNLIKKVREYETDTYQYFPLTDTWVESRYYQDSKEEWFVYDDYLKNVRSILYNGVIWVTEWIHEYYYYKDGTPSGELTADYDFEGNIRYGWGHKSTINEENGYIVKRYYEFDTDLNSWKENQKEEFSLNFDTPWIYNPSEIRTCKYYLGYTGELILEYEEVYSWITESVVKRVTTHPGYEQPYTSIRYYLVENQGLNESTDFYYDEETGNYAIAYYEYDESKDTYIDYYSYYDKAGNLLQKIRITGLTWEQWDGNKWIPCTSDITIYDGGDRIEAKFNSKGQVIQITEYDDGIFDERHDYVYIENGYEETVWEYKRNSTELYKSELNIYTFTDTENTTTYYEYYEDGIISYASRTVENIVDQYYIHYRLENDKWVESNRTVNALYEILPDGKQQLIEREFDNEGNIVNVSKSIEYYDYDTNYYYSERYSWDKATNSWIGMYKSESGNKIAPDFKVIQPAEPTYFYDEYFIPANMSGYDVSSSRVYYFNKDWNWSTEKNDWILNYSRDVEFKLDGNTLTTIETSYYNENDFDISEMKETVDNNRRLISNYISRKTPYDSDESSYLYSYDQDGRLTEKTEDYADYTHKYKYTYGEITYISEVEDVISSNNYYTVNGKTISVIGTSPAEIYNTQGLKIAVVNAGESIELPVAGVYIVTIDNNSSKVIIK